jgi:hypothetical protein
MQQHNCQLNKANLTANGYGRIFVSPMTENISFSWDYLKHIVSHKV